MKTLLFLALLATSILAAVVKPNNLLLRLPFDSTPVKDESPYQKLLITKGTPALVPGKFGTAARFNPGGVATDAYFTGQWQAGSIFSACSWVQFSALGGFPKVLSQKNAFDDKNGWEFQYNDGAFSLVTGADGARSEKKDYVVGTWYHVAMTVNNATVKFYLDGQDMTADGTASIITPFGGKDVTVGTSANGQNVNNGGQWQGALDEVRVYDYSLSAEDVLAIFQETDSKVEKADPNTALPSIIGTSCVARNNSADPTSSIKLTYTELYADATGAQFPGKSNEYMSFSYVASSPIDGAQLRLTGTLKVANVGSTPLTINSIEVQSATPDSAVRFTATGVNNGQTIAPGAEATITVRYVNFANLEAKTVVRNFLVIKSNDVLRPEISVTLAGVYMTKKEGGDEIPLESIVPALGFSVNTAVGYNNFGIENMNHNLIGDGFISLQYKAADPTKKIWMQMTASYAPCCGADSRPGVGLSTGDCNVRVREAWTQSLYPLSANGEGVAATTCNAPTGLFTLRQDGEWSSNPWASRGSYIAMRFYPLRDADGTLHPNTYIVAQDYLHPVGCGTAQGQANCDYNDNTYTISNIVPADSDAIDRSKVADLPIRLTFDHSFDSGLADSNGNRIGFPQYTFSNVLDTYDRVRSYAPSNLRLDLDNNALVVRTTPGNLKTNDMNNGLRFGLNIEKKSFGVSATVKNANALPADVSAGVFLGSDQDNFVSLTVVGGVIKAEAELISFYQLQRGGDLGIEPKVDVNSFSLGNVTLPQGYTNVELFIFAEPTTKSVSFGYNIGNGVVLFESRWTLPGRNPTTGLSSTGRVLGWGAAAGIVAFGGNSEVSFADFAVQTCVAAEVISAPTDAATSETSDSNATSGATEDTNNTTGNGVSEPQPSNQGSNTLQDDATIVNTNTDVMSGAGFIAPTLAFFLLALIAL